MPLLWCPHLNGTAPTPDRIKQLHHDHEDQYILPEWEPLGDTRGQAVVSEFFGVH
jgi:hypothetical protein